MGKRREESWKKVVLESFVWYKQTQNSLTLQYLFQSVPTKTFRQMNNTTLTENIKHARKRINGKYICYECESNILNVYVPNLFTNAHIQGKKHLAVHSKVHSFNRLPQIFHYAQNINAS